MRVDVADLRSLPELWRHRRSLLGAQRALRAMGIGGAVHVGGLRVYGWSAASLR